MTQNNEDGPKINYKKLAGGLGDLIKAFSGPEAQGPAVQATDKELARTFVVTVAANTKTNEILIKETRRLRLAIERLADSLLEAEEEEEET